MRCVALFLRLFAVLSACFMTFVALLYLFTKNA